MSFSWEDCGVFLNFEQHSLPSTSMCDIVVSALIGGHFQFPERTELVSAVYAMSFSKDTSQPVRIDIQHCVSLKNEQQQQQLVFAVAPLDGGLPFRFEIIEGGNFPLDSEYGSLNKSDVTSFLIGIVKLNNDGKVTVVNKLWFIHSDTFIYAFPKCQYVIAFVSILARLYLNSYCNSIIHCNTAAELSNTPHNIYTCEVYYDRMGSDRWLVRFIIVQNIRVFLKVTYDNTI